MQCVWKLRYSHRYTMPRKAVNHAVIVTISIISYAWKLYHEIIFRAVSNISRKFYAIQYSSTIWHSKKTAKKYHSIYHIENTHTHTHTHTRARTRSLSLFFLFQRSFAATVATIIVVSIILRNALRMSRIIREDIRIHCTFASTKHQTFRGLSGGKYDNKLIV